MMLIAALLSLATLSWAQAGRIRTIGQGQVWVAPDTAEATFSVRAEDRQLAPAREKAAAAMTRLLDALRRADVPNLTLGTASVSVTPLVRQPPQGAPVGPGQEVRREIVGYQVTHTLSARLKGTAEALATGMSRLIDTAVANGVTTFFGPNFYLEDQGPANQQALGLATRDAMAKAQALAQAAGVTITSYSYIGMYPEDEPGGPQPMPYMREMAMGAGGMADTPTPIEVRDLQISTQVWVTAVY
jgi:hypothetical protein